MGGCMGCVAGRVWLAGWLEAVWLDCGGLLDVGWREAGSVIGLGGGIEV